MDRPSEPVDIVMGRDREGHSRIEVIPAQPLLRAQRGSADLVPLHI